MECPAARRFHRDQVTPARLEELRRKRTAACMCGHRIFSDEEIRAWQAAAQRAAEEPMDADEIGAELIEPAFHEEATSPRQVPAASSESDADSRVSTTARQRMAETDKEAS